MSQENQNVLLEREGDIATITLSRPRYRNAVNRQTLEDLGEILSELERERPRVVILTGADPGFCSGIDLKENRESTAEYANRRVALMHHVLGQLRRLPVPVILAINGVAVGLGCELAISGDLRIASPDARFAYLEPRVAVPSPAHHLVNLIGLSHAQDLLLTARWVDADEALAMGLVSRIADPPIEAARDLASELMKLSPLSLARTKENIWISIEGGVEAASEHHIGGVTEAASTRDRAEALAAFAEKRDPRFTGE